VGNRSIFFILLCLILFCFIVANTDNQLTFCSLFRGLFEDIFSMNICSISTSFRDSSSITLLLNVGIIIQSSVCIIFMSLVFS
jgi:hypothetical protein